LHQWSLRRARADPVDLGSEIMQTPFLQDLLQGQGGVTVSRRLMLGCSPPAPEAIESAARRPIWAPGVVSLSHSKSPLPALLSSAIRRPWAPRVLAAIVALAAAITAITLSTGSSSGDLQSQISANRSAAASLRAEIASDSAQISRTTGGLEAARTRLAVLQRDLDTRESQLRDVQTSLVAARDRLVALENRLRRASIALAANLVAKYESAQPDMMNVILDAHGFPDLLERINFLQRVGHQDAQIVGFTRSTRAEVSREANRLASLEKRDRALTAQILGRRNDVAAMQAALLTQQVNELGARSKATSKLHDLTVRLDALQRKAAAEAAAAARAAATQSAGTTGGAVVSGLAINTGGMVKAPPGAPAAIGQVMAAGNAIATLPYIWGGGHGSFHASGYDCSGSVSYALAAAGLLTSPLDSTGFESWGAPGPGRWITVYANAGHAFMVVAGWRFDTVALAEGGTRWAQSMASTAGFVARHPAGL
jgi:peptidoglycan hydrolase CwlO-like protein